MSKGAGKGLTRQARDWLRDLQWGDDPDFKRMPEAQVRAGVERFYDGGWKGFKQDSCPARPERKQETRTQGRPPR